MSDSGSSSSGSSSSSAEGLDQPLDQTKQTHSTQIQTGTKTEGLNSIIASSSFDSSLFHSLNPSSSQSNQQLPLHRSSNTNLLSQDTQSSSILNTQSSTTIPSSDLNHLPKNAPSTAPTRPWISQRIARTIHIDEDNSQKPNESQPIPLDPNQNYPTTSSSSQRIIELGIVEEQLSQLLGLASDVLGSLTPPLNRDQSSTDQAIENFSSSIGEYFELLNKIQLGLRTSLAQLRVARISTRILFEPAHVRVPNCPIGLGNVRLSHSSLPSSSKSNLNQDKIVLDEESSLSLGSLIAERNAWKDFVDSLESIKSLHLSNSLSPSS